MSCSALVTSTFPLFPLIYPFRRRPSSAARPAPLVQRRSSSAARLFLTRPSDIVRSRLTHRCDIPVPFPHLVPSSHPFPRRPLCRSVRQSLVPLASACRSARLFLVPSLRICDVATWRPRLPGRRRYSVHGPLNRHIFISEPFL